MNRLRRWSVVAVAMAMTGAWGASIVHADAADATGDVATSASQLQWRVGQFNLPGADKLDHATTRAKRAAQLIRRADLDVVVLNELVGPGRDGMASRPSRFGRSVARALGGRWRLIVPTTGWNENYIAYRVDRLAVVTHFADEVVPGIGSGRRRLLTSRHVTPVLFADIASGQQVLVAGTHLVDRDRPGARTQAAAVGRIVERLAGGHPVIVAGDMNTSARLGGLTRHGLKDARRHAAARSRADHSTYVPYGRDRPRRRAREVIDQIYVPRAWTVSRWVTVADSRRGVFRSPRPSDHLLVWASVRSRGTTTIEVP